MSEQGSLRPRGHVEVMCSAPACRWCFWIHCADATLPAGPFFCEDHDLTLRYDSDAYARIDDGATVCVHCGKPCEARTCHACWKAAILDKLGPSGLSSDCACCAVERGAPR
jgi:hypothetical protein